MSEVADYIERGAKRTGFRRDFFVEKNIPTVAQNVVVFPFYGDMRSTCILSSFVLKEYKKVLARQNKYLIMCSWRGYKSLFPYVDEYWSLSDNSVSKGLALGANNFYNGSDVAIQIGKDLVQNFDVVTYKDMKSYFENGFGAKYLAEVREPYRYLLQIPSATKIGTQFQTEMSRKPGKKIVVHPVTRMRVWQRGKLNHIQISKEFWSHLFERLLAEGIVPVVYQNHASFDMSREFADRCIYVVPDEISDLLAAMSYVGCALDIFSGFSMLATLARCPSLVVDERLRYMTQKDYEIDDLCKEIPKDHIFAFSTMLLSGGPKDWDNSFVENILMRLRSFLPRIEGKSWLPLNEQYSSVSYERVRERKSKRMGVTFVRAKHK